ncbi:hypothetical protein L2U69_00565 [Zavarzinia compransoris]|uniref:calcium-binding protein n=1 Tax=Zavarzinia marina TaxID=2911065 RepID=UPI001F277E84|nr:calcium-binding protein [Zavarzinia marina]MCF4164135.1 hypothetical protein [Zavarzinia marina]
MAFAEGLFDEEDIIAGTNGNDTITGTSGDDAIAGGLGNDTLRGGEGNDIYIYARGDGNDSIYENLIGDFDTLILHGIAPADVSFIRNGDQDITLVIAESSPGAGDGGTIFLDGQVYFQGAQGVEEIHFDDDTVWTMSQVADMVIAQYETDGNDTVVGTNRGETIQGGLGNDTLRGGEGNDVYIYARGDGNDGIYENLIGDFDTLILHGIAPADVSFIRNGDQDITLVIAESSPGAGDGGTIFLDGQVYFQGAQGVEEIHFDDDTVWTKSQVADMVIAQYETDGNDTVVGTNRGETIQGGLGDDTLRGGEGNDVYIYARGDGNDSIYENVIGASDTLILYGIATADVSFIRNGDQDITLVIAESSPGAGDGGTIFLDGQMYFQYTPGVEEIHFDDDTVWTKSQVADMVIAQYETDGNDTVVGTNRGDTIQGGLGDDTLRGGEGNDIYIYARGDGNDSIYENLIGNFDTLILHGIAPADVSFIRNGDEDITLVIAESSPGASDGGTIFLDGQIYFNDTQGVEEVHFDDGTVWTMSAIADMVIALDITDGDDSAVGTNGGDIIHGGLGNDTLAGDDGNDQLFGDAGDDRLLGGNGDDALSGGAGDDMLIGSTGFDSFDGGEGSDTADFSYSSSDWTLDLSAGTAMASGSPETLVSIENLIAGSGSDTLVGNDGANSLDGGAGADTLTGGLGDDTYVVDDADDVIVEVANQGVDTVVTTLAAFALDNTVENLTYTGEGNFTGTGTAYANVITGGDGNDVLSAGGREDTLTGGAGDDVLQGAAGVDTLFGGDGNDHLQGGDGGDTMVGGAGDDTYDVDIITDIADESTGSGHDIVIASATYTLGAGIEDLNQIGDVGIAGTGNDLDNTLSGNLGGNRLLGEDGNDTISGGIGEDRLEGGDGDDVLSGGNDDDLVYGEAGNDVLDGGAGDDIMRGSTGDDTYIVDSSGDVASEVGGDGYDTIMAGASFVMSNGIEELIMTRSTAIDATGNAVANTITGGAGANVLSGLGGDDTIDGLGGGDTLDGGAGADTLSGGGGQDVFVFAAGEANGDVVTDFAGAGANTGDSFLFTGYGTAAEGASFVQVDATHWQVNSASGAIQEVIEIVNGANIHASDFVFV